MNKTPIEAKNESGAVANRFVDLIAKLEGFAVSDTWMDCLIREVVEGWKNVGGGWREWPDGKRERYDYGFAPPYTGSIDAAITLIPDGWPISQLAWWPSTPKGFESERACSVTIMALDHRGFGNAREQFSAKAPKPALAICIAALRAKATMTAPVPAQKDNPS